MKSMNACEKTAAALILPGMLLLCAEQLPTAMAGIALLGAGAFLLNWAEARAYIKKKAARKPRRHIEKRHSISITEKNRKVKVMGHPFDGID